MEDHARMELCLVILVLDRLRYICHLGALTGNICYYRVCKMKGRIVELSCLSHSDLCPFFLYEDGGLVPEYYEHTGKDAIIFVY